MKKYTKEKNNLAVFLAIGESLEDFRSKGQLKRLMDYNIKSFCRNFNHVYVFSYKNESYRPFNNCTVITNQYGLHRYIYALLLPLIERRFIRNCSVSRGLQLTGGIPATVSKLFFKIPFIVNYGYDYETFAKIEGKQIQAILYRIIKYPILMFADKVIATTEANAIEVSEITNEDKVEIIPNGVDLKLFKPTNLNQNKTLKITFIGRLEKQKNLDNLITACSSLTFPYQLKFYGQGSQKSDLVKLSKKIGVNLKIFPPQDYHKLPKIFKKTDIFVLPSIVEGNPKILLEAMAAAKSIVATDVSGINSLIENGKTGLLTQVDAKSIANAIKKLSNKKIRSKLGNNARLYVQNNFDIKILQAKEVNLLLELAK